MGYDEERMIAEERERRNREGREPDPNAPWIDHDGRLIAEPPGPVPPPPPGVTWPKIGDYIDDYGYTPSEEETRRHREGLERRRRQQRLESLAVRPQVCLAFQIRRAGRMLTRVFNFDLRPLRVTQLAVLVAMAKARVPESISELASQLGMHRSTLSRSLARLAKRDLVDFAPNPNDRRERLPSITDAGRQALERQSDAWMRAEVGFALAHGMGERGASYATAIALARSAHRRMQEMKISGASREVPHAFGAGSSDVWPPRSRAQVTASPPS